MKNINLSAELLAGVKLAKLAESARNIENHAATGDDDQTKTEVFHALQVRAMLREEKPRVSKVQSASLDSIAADIAAHCNNSDRPCEFVVTARYSEGKRKGQAQTVVMYDEEKKALELTRSNAGAVLSALRTFYPAD